MTAKAYIGNELELFARAINWKRYVAGRIIPELGEHVLEVGAGLAESTRWLCDGSQARWLCLEPDTALCEQIQARVDDGTLPACCTVRNGVLTVFADRKSEFDSILYLDVLEHIENDRIELQRAAGLLKAGGKIIVLAPAHSFLYTPFDRQIGHFRRYNRTRLRQICPDSLTLTRLEYLDSVGMLASLANRCLLKQSMPTRRQIAFWDRSLVRASTFCDRLLGHRLGKSILAVMQRKDAGTKND